MQILELHSRQSISSKNENYSLSWWSPNQGHCVKVKAGWGSPCEGSSSGPKVSGVLTGTWGRLAISPSVGVLSWDWEEEDEECVLSLELLRVSVLVLVFFIFLRLARGALSTVWSRKPSRLHLLKALKVALTQECTDMVEDPRMSGVISGLEDSWLSSCSQAL